MAQTPTALEKYEALGNDYLVVAGPLPGDDLGPYTPAAVRRVCHRNLGLGSDGILCWQPLADGGFRLRILNPDGSEAEKSGNGLRIFALFLFHRGLVQEASPFAVQTLGGLCSCTVLPGAERVVVDMGRARVEGEPTALPLRDGAEASGFVANVGNPHFVVRVPVAAVEDEEMVRALGPQIEKHDAFPQGTNVQLAAPVDESTVRVQIWERGAGYTLASGSSSCAVAATAVSQGWCQPGPVDVLCAGGTIRVTVPAADLSESIQMEGPVRRVGRMEPDMQLFSSSE